MGVVDDVIGRRRHESFRAHIDAPRTQRAHMQPDRCRAGTAVEDEDQRPLGDLGSRLQRVGGVEDLGDDLVVLVFQRQLAGRGLVGQRVIAQRQLMRGDDRRLFADFGLVFLVVFGLVGHCGGIAFFSRSRCHRL